LYLSRFRYKLMIESRFGMNWVVVFTVSVSTYISSAWRKTTFSGAALRN
jgi:hypothetical protein